MDADVDWRGKVRGVRGTEETGLRANRGWVRIEALLEDYEVVGDDVIKYPREGN